MHELVQHTWVTWVFYSISSMNTLCGLELQSEQWSWWADGKDISNDVDFIAMLACRPLWGHFGRTEESNVKMGQSTSPCFESL